jgi:hypothetical protein
MSIKSPHVLSRNQTIFRPLHLRIQFLLRLYRISPARAIVHSCSRLLACPHRVLVSLSPYQPVQPSYSCRTFSPRPVPIPPRLPRVAVAPLRPQTSFLARPSPLPLVRPRVSPYTHRTFTSRDAPTPPSPTCYSARARLLACPVSQCLAA